MINVLLNGIFDIVTFLINIILTPIDIVINNYIPSLSNGINYVTDFFDSILSVIPWVLSWFHLPILFLELVVAYWIFKLTVPLAIHTIKLAVAWWSELAP